MAALTLVACLPTGGACAQAVPAMAEVVVSGSRSEQLTRDTSDTSRTSRITPNTQFTIGQATTLDLSNQWRLRKDLRLNVAVHNLTNRKYWLWPDVYGLAAASTVNDACTQPGRSLHAALVMDFRASRPPSAPAHGGTTTPALPAITARTTHAGPSDHQHHFARRPPKHVDCRAGWPHRRSHRRPAGRGP
jgi:hypothetical protein